MGLSATLYYFVYKHAILSKFRAVEVSFCEKILRKIQKIYNSNVFFRKIKKPLKIQDRDQPPGLKRD